MMLSSAFDILVIGAGPAGIAAATRAAESGKHVLLLDESPQVGGQIWRHRDPRGLPTQARRWLSGLGASGAIVTVGTSVTDVSANRDGASFTIVAEQGNTPKILRANAIVLATGARERFLPFPGWTLPGVIGVGAGQALLKSGMSFAGKRVVIAGSGPLLLPVAASLSRDGARVQLVAEQASSNAVARFTLSLWNKPSTLFQAARYRAAFVGARYQTGTWISAVRGTGRVEEVDVTNGRTTRTIACDVLCAAFGLVPNTELARLLGCAVRDGAVVVNERQETTRARVYCAGEPTGIGGVDLAIAEGEIAGLFASGSGTPPGARLSQRSRLRASAASMNMAFALRNELRSLAVPETIVCRCEDVTLASIHDGWTSRQAKLYTRAGMGACQGRVCGAALEFIRGWSPDTVRLPIQPALFSTLIADSAQADTPLDHGA